MRAQGVLEVWSERPRPEVSRLRHLVELDQPGEPGQVHGDHTAVPVWHASLHPADHAGPPSVGNRRQTPLRAHLEDPANVVGVTRAGDHVGGAVEATAEAADDVPVGTAHRMADALRGVPAENAVKGPGRLDPWRSDVLQHLRERHRLLDPIAAEAEPAAQLRRERLQRRAVGSAGCLSPSPMAPLGTHPHEPR